MLVKLLQELQKQWQNNGDEMSRADLKRKGHKGRRKVGSKKRRNRRRIRLGLKVRKRRGK